MFKKIIAILMVSAVIFTSFATGAFAAIYKYGDVNLDKKINSSDALYILQISTGLKTPNGMQKALADVSNDGKINSNDALTVLMYATGLLKEFKKTDKNTLKVTKVDPIVNSETYTISFSTSADGMTIDCTLSSNGKDNIISASYLGFELRFLQKDGKSYLLIPLKKAYCEADVPENIEIIRVMMFEILKTDGVYSATTQEKVGLKTYTCETFYTAANNTSKYYFTGNSLKSLSLTDANGESQIFNFSEFKASADDSIYSIPSDYKKDDALKDLVKK